MLSFGRWVVLGLLCLLLCSQTSEAFGCVTCSFPGLNYFCCILVEACCKKPNDNSR